jgi:exodeoxyribonuclease V alpha subunit
MQAFAEFQVLCALRHGPWGVEAINQQLSRALGFTQATTQHQEAWFVGRPVMLTRNDYQFADVSATGSLRVLTRVK